MGRYCLINKCKNTWYPNCEVTFHRFPTNEEARQKWLASIPPELLEGRKLTKYSSVCSEHFALDCFARIYTGNLLNKLKKTAVPTLFHCDPTIHDPSIPLVDDSIKIEYDPSDSNVEEIYIPAEDIPIDGEMDEIEIKEHDYTISSSESNLIKEELPELRPPSPILRLSSRRKMQTALEKRQMDIIRLLKRRLKRRDDKIRKLKELWTTVKEKSENGQILKVALENYVPREKQDLFWNELWHSKAPFGRKSYSRSVKEFAITMYILSPEAYEFLREKITLPHSSSVLRWIARCDRNKTETNALEMGQSVEEEIVETDV